MRYLSIGLNEHKFTNTTRQQQHELNYKVL
jgi:hypothetical protein